MKWIQLSVYDYGDPHTDRLQAMLGHVKLVNKMRWELRKVGRGLIVLSHKKGMNNGRRRTKVRAREAGA